MNTNQDTALTNQDAFEKWYKTSFPLDDISDMNDNHIAKQAYKAATKASEIEINSLKERVAELQSHLSGQSIEIANNDVTLESYAHKVAELQADNERLREALDDMVESYQYEASSENPPLLNARKILASTTAQSLAEHDNDVIERCAKVCESLKEQDYCVDVRAGAEAIRALKVTP